MEHYAVYLLKLKYDGYIVLQRNRVQNDTLHKQKHIFSLNKSKVIKKKHSAGDFSLVKGQNAFSDTIIF